MSIQQLVSAEGLADQALENLVNQFARPMDFLRELVQNSIDAGTARVDVWVRFDRPTGEDEQGVLEIHVDDYGEGMDEDIIDTQLTRMFSSTKEDDLTKIGKFGIGFTSIFAIEPDAVLLQTGRHGQSWELLFHPDRSFDKTDISAPVDGTRITLYKRMRSAEVSRFVRECRWILTWWCEHSDTPITFWDRTDEVTAPAEVDHDDPFAAFEDTTEPAGPETITRPMTLDAELALEHAEDGVRVTVGYGQRPRFAFYNGGLTLLNTSNPDTLDPFSDELGHLVFKVKCDLLEHTLTRDNVLKDEQWLKAMRVLRNTVGRLRHRLLDRAMEEAKQGGDLPPWQARITAECRATRFHESDGFANRCPFLDWEGRLVTLAEVVRQEGQVGAVLLHAGDAPLAHALADKGLNVLADTPEARDLLQATDRSGAIDLLKQARRLVRADDAFVLPQLVDPHMLPAIERRLVEAAASLLHEAVGDRIAIRVGEFGGPEAAADRPLALDGPVEGGIFQRAESTWFRLPSFLRKRCLLVNRHHPAFRAQVAAAGEHLPLSALALLQGILHTEGLAPDKTYQALVSLVGDQIVDGTAHGGAL